MTAPCYPRRMVARCCVCGRRTNGLYVVLMMPGTPVTRHDICDKHAEAIASGESTSIGPGMAASWWRPPPVRHSQLCGDVRVAAAASGPGPLPPVPAAPPPVPADRARVAAGMADVARAARERLERGGKP